MDQSIAPIEDESPVEPTPKLKVLIVEDDKSTRALLSRMLNARGHEATGCYSAEEAVAILEEEFYPLIILDIQLPGMSGLELCKVLRTYKEGKYYYILVGTGHNRPEDLREILKAGADDYIAKPYNPGLLDVRLAVAEATVADIAERKGLEDKLTFLAMHDPLTGLYNRSQLLPAVDEAIALAERGETGAILYIDLDNFKIINDSLGHDAGDRLLVRIGGILRKNVRTEDALVRFGGDEFVIVMPGCPMAEAKHVAERLRGELDELEFVEQGQRFHPGASIGIAMIDGQAKAGDIVGLADAACYAAKARGRNRVEIYEEEGGEMAQLIADTNWALRIKEAMRDRSLRLWFQPVVSLSDESIVFHEVLLRYFDARISEPIHPAAFLSAVMRSGQSGPLDRFVVKLAVEALELYPGIGVSINLSGGSFRDERICECVEELLANSSVDPKRIYFEITEAEVIPNLTQASEIIRRLQRLGCHCGLDDFGAGFSSLSYLRQLPIDFIKIDGAFVRDLPNQSFNQAIVKATLVIAEALGIKTVAEYVENREIYEMLQAFGVTYVQGHYLSQPTPIPVMPKDLFKKPKG